MNRYKITFEAVALSKKWSTKKFKEHLESELRKLKIVMSIKKLEVEPAGIIFTRRDLL